MENQVRHHLAPYACCASQSRGRRHFEKDGSNRTVFQRDRDRIIHSTAFRRLMHKTQVFVCYQGDHYRTRLTHTLEVAQIARDVARTLNIDEDLTEVISLAHDLGHPPFGHAGEGALNRMMRPYGGFDHNAQSLRVVTELEHRYAEFEGLNLSWESLEGLVKHNGPLTLQDGTPIGFHSDCHLPHLITSYTAIQYLELWSFSSLEGQVASIADDIAYNAHDLDDGLRAGFLDLDMMRDVPLFGICLAIVDKTYPDLDNTKRGSEALRRLIAWMVDDLTNEIGRRLNEEKPCSVDAIRYSSHSFAGFSAQMQQEADELKNYLRTHVYQHEHVAEKMDKAARLVDHLFTRYMEDPFAFSGERRFLIAGLNESDRSQKVCDFIAGMTDFFALREYERLFGVSPSLE